MRRLLPIVMLLALAPVAAAEQRIEAREASFEPARVVAFDWETVRWSWPEEEVHGIVSAATGEVWCEPARRGCASYLSRPGEHPYRCPLHPEMTGVVVVERRAADAAGRLHASFFVRTQGLTATFDASPVANSRTAIESYEWDFGDGIRGQGSLVEHGYAHAGEYVVRLTVVDELGNEDTGGRRVEVRVQGDPEAAFRTSASGRAVLFEAEPTAAPHEWDFGDGHRLRCDAACEASSAETVASTPSSVVHVYRRGGEFVVNHTVGERWSASVVRVEAPETFDATPTRLRVALDASALPHYGNATYRWLFGDLDRAEGAQVTHEFPKTGRWSVQLTLRDDVGEQTIERELPLQEEQDAHGPGERSLDAASDAALVSAGSRGGDARATPLPSMLAIILALAIAVRHASERYK